MKTIKLKHAAVGILLLLLAVQSGYADGIKFQENKTWKELLALAKKEKKILFLDAYATWCGPCKYLQKSVFTQDGVGAYFNGNFINAAIDMETGEGPSIAETFGVTAYPTLFFIDGDGKLLHKYVGALEGEELIALAKNASNPAKQYYTLKAKASAGQLSPETLLEWAEAAEQMEDKEAKDIITAYVNAPLTRFTDKNVLLLALDYAGALSEDKMNYIVQHKAEVKNALSFTDEQFDAAFTRKALSIAIDKALGDSSLDFALFKNILSKYVPTKAELETRKMKVKYAFLKKDSELGTNEFVKLLNDAPALKLNIFTVANMVLDYAEEIVETGDADLVIDKISAYQLSAEDSEKVYYKYFALLALYYYKDDKAKIKDYADKLNATPGTPENILKMSNTILEKMVED